MRIRVGDTVEVITGGGGGTGHEWSAGARGRVLRVDPRAGKVVVEGINRVYKHVRRSQRNPQGGRLSKEMPIDLSNVMLVCPACGQAARTGVRYEEDGAKVRFCKKCGANAGQIAPPKARYARKPS